MPGPLSVHQTLPHGLPKNHSRIPIRPATTAKINTSPVVRFTTLPYPAPSNIRPFLFSIIHRQDDCKAARQQNSEKSRPDENSLFKPTPSSACRHFLLIKQQRPQELLYSCGHILIAVNGFYAQRTGMMHRDPLRTRAQPQTHKHHFVPTVINRQSENLLYNG